MSSKPRVASAIAGQPPHLGSVLAHQPALGSSFGSLYATFWQQGRVSQRVKEVTRIRNARITDCGL